MLESPVDGNHAFRDFSRAIKGCLGILQAVMGLIWIIVIGCAGSKLLPFPVAVTIVPFMIYKGIIEHHIANRRVRRADAGCLHKRQVKAAKVVTDKRLRGRKKLIDLRFTISERRGMAN